MSIAIRIIIVICTSKRTQIFRKCIHFLFEIECLQLWYSMWQMYHHNPFRNERRKKTWIQLNAIQNVTTNTMHMMMKMNGRCVCLECTIQLRWWHKEKIKLNEICAADNARCVEWNVECECERDCECNEWYAFTATIPKIPLKKYILCVYRIRAANRRPTERKRYESYDAGLRWARIQPNSHNT